jgi:hypothetical protein
MENLRLTAKDFMNITNLPKSTVYNWIALGKLKTEMTPKGKIIIITQNEIESLKVFESNSIPEYSEPVQENSQNIQRENTLDILEYVRPFMEKAGKVDLLEDLSRQKEKDLDYWREQYFSQKHQLENLTKLNSKSSKKHLIIYSILGVITFLLLASLVFIINQPPKIKTVEKPAIKTITKPVPPTHKNIKL